MTPTPVSVRIDGKGVTVGPTNPSSPSPLDREPKPPAPRSRSTCITPIALFVRAETAKRAEHSGFTCDPF